MRNVGELSNEALLAGVQASIGQERRWVARVVAYLAEIDRRRLHLEAACSSLFDFCRRRLGMSEGEAFRRMTAARLVQRFPLILDLLDRGEVHLSALVLLRDHLTDDNHEALLREASGKSKLEVEEMLAARFPRPDVPSRIAELARSTTPQAALVLGGSAATPAPAPALALASAPAPALASAPERALPSAPAPGRPMSTQDEPRPRIEPLSPARYRVELTVSKELRDKLERAKDLMRHRNPSGDLALILDKALDLLLAKLEKERLGKTTRPRRETQKNDEDAADAADAANAVGAADAANAVGAADAADAAGAGGAADPHEKSVTRTRYIPRSVRRAVYERDGEQCAFVDDQGRRCPSRAFLELDHVVSKALGGTEDVENLTIRCREHNKLHAEQVFGRAHVERQIHLRQEKRERTDASPFEVAARGLRNLGFREPEVRRALAVVRKKLGPSVTSVEIILREALAVAT